MEFLTLHTSKPPNLHTSTAMPHKIAIITPTFPPYRGGIGKVAEMDAIQLAGLGHEVHVYAPNRGATAGPDAPFSLHRLPAWFHVGNAAFAPAVGRLLAAHDTVILHYPFYGGAEFCLHRRPGEGRLFVTYHMDTVGTGLKRAFFRLHRRLVLPRLIRAADKVIVTSVDYASTGFLRPFLDAMPEKFTELPPSVDIRRFRPGPKPVGLMEHHGISRDERVIVFLGGLDKAHYFKGVTRLLLAMTAGPLMGARLVIVGEGSERHGFREYADRLGLGTRVIFAGGVSDEELPAYLRLGDVFAFPSLDRSEAFGIAALEALATGVPAVASDLPGVRTIVRDDVTGFVSVPGSASSLAMRLTSLLGDEAARRRMGAAGREMAEKSYSDEARRERWRIILDAK